MSLPDSLESKNYALIESSLFLCTLPNLPKLAVGGTLQLSDPDYTISGRLMLFKQNILSAIKVMYLRMIMKSRRASRTDFTTEMSKKKKKFRGVYYSPDKI